MTARIETPEALLSIAQAVQPLVFETGLDAIPYSTAGTVFLVSFENRWYVVTTRHGLRPESPPAICVFPNDCSRRIFSLRNVFFVPSADVAEDFVDLAVIDIDPRYQLDPELRQAQPLDLSVLYFDDWESRLDDHEIYLLGYPNELSHVDFEDQFLRTDRVVLRGETIDRSPIDHLYQLILSDTRALVSFSGLSGEPVVAVSESSKGRRALFCGMAVRGTPGSGLVHFIPAQVIVHAIKVKIIQDRRHDV
jgi:hypothetical protein